MLKCLERKRLETKYDLHPQAAPQYLHITVTATILYTLEKVWSKSHILGIVF